MKKALAILVLFGLLAGGASAWLGGQAEWQTILAGANTSFLATESNAAPWGAFADGGHVGYPVTLQTYIVPFDAGFEPATNYARIVLEWHYGTNTAESTNWTAITTIEGQFQVFTGAVMTVAYTEWDPPTKGTDYLVRVYCQTLPPWSAENLVRTETNVGPDGNGETHDDEEVLHIYVEDDRRPGTGE